MKLEIRQTSGNMLAGGGIRATLASNAHTPWPMQSCQRRDVGVDFRVSFIYLFIYLSIYLFIYLILMYYFIQNISLHILH